MTHPHIEPQIGQIIITRDKHQVMVVAVDTDESIIALENGDYRSIDTQVLTSLLNPQEVN